MTDEKHLWVYCTSGHEPQLMDNVLPVIRKGQEMALSCPICGHTCLLVSDQKITPQMDLKD